MTAGRSDTDTPGQLGKPLEITGTDKKNKDDEVGQKKQTMPFRVKCEDLLKHIQLIYYLISQTA